MLIPLLLQISFSIFLFEFFFDYSSKGREGGGGSDFKDMWNLIGFILISAEKGVSKSMQNYHF